MRTLSLLLLSAVELVISLLPVDGLPCQIQGITGDNACVHELATALKSGVNCQLICVAMPIIQLGPHYWILLICEGNNPAAICAMCSEANAAVRWTTAVAVERFNFFKIRYTCSDPNGTVIYDEVKL